MHCVGSRDMSLAIVMHCVGSRDMSLAIMMHCVGSRDLSLAFLNRDALCGLTSLEFSDLKS